MYTSEIETRDQHIQYCTTAKCLILVCNSNELKYFFLMNPNNSDWLIDWISLLCHFWQVHSKKNTTVKNKETHTIIETLIKVYKRVCRHKNIDRYALLRSQVYALVNLYMHVYEVTCAKRRHHRRRQATASQRKLCDAKAYIRPSKNVEYLYSIISLSILTSILRNDAQWLIIDTE